MILCVSLTYDSGSLFNAFATVVSLLTTTMPDFDQWFVLKRVPAIGTTMTRLTRWPQSRKARREGDGPPRLAI
jgi:hypothetical protein